MAKAFGLVDTRANLTTALNTSDISQDSIVFVEGTHEIWTHGKYYAAVDFDALLTSINKTTTDYVTFQALVEAIYNNSAVEYTLSSVTDDELTALGSNVKEAYKLMAGSAQKGSTIKIYKDSSLKSVTLVSENNTSTGGLKQLLRFVYILETGAESTVDLDVSTFLVEAEFGNGLQVSSAGVASARLGKGLEFNSSATDGQQPIDVKVGDGLAINSSSSAVEVDLGNGLEISDSKIAIKKDTSSESYLSVSSDGIKVSGIDTAISNAMDWYVLRDE